MTSEFRGYRITGAKAASGRAKKLSAVALKNIQQQAQERADETVRRFREAMDAEYTGQWSRGALAKSIQAKVTIRGNGVDVKFFIANLRELHYVTAALGGYFQNFPVTPFVISAKRGKYMKIPFPSSQARQFIRQKLTGRFAGARRTTGAEGEWEAGILVRSVLWGKKTGGFKRDVITEVGQQEGELFIQDMQDAVSGAIITTTTGG